jgi:membrane fusion protein (multidrug efflux system)
VGLSGCDTASDAQQTPALPVKVIEAANEDVQLYLEMVGTTMGAQDVPIRARVEGFLESMDFAEGTFVKKSTLLYVIDDEPFLAKVVEAESQLAGAQTALAKSQADLSRIKPLAEMNAVSAQDLDAAVASESAARAGVRASEAGLDLANISLSYTRIIAPIDGLIGISKARPGEFVGREPNPVVLNILSDVDPIRVRFSISESEYLILARTYLANSPVTGQADLTEAEDGAEVASRENKPDLQLLLSDGSEHPYKGQAIAAAQSIDAETGTYTVEAAFPNPGRILLPGQFARVKARYQKIDNALVIPRQALSELQGLFRVYVVDEANTVVMRSVEIGPYTGNDVVIEAGLAAGEKVIVEGLQKVRPGMIVNPQLIQSAAQAD